MAVWLVRAGSHGEGEGLALEKGIAVVGWTELPDLAAADTREKLTTLLQKSYPDANKHKIGNYVGQIWSFRGRMQKGDLVVLPLKTTSMIAAGKVTGEYRYEADNPEGARHTRPVKWLRDSFPRKAFGQDLLHSLGAFMTVCQIVKNDAERRISAIVSGKPDPRSRQKPDGNPRRRSTAQPRADRGRLVIQHLEDVSRKVLDRYPGIVREFTFGRNGVYALYRGDRLYYVGLARDLRSRLRGHLRDRHVDSWDRFSVYLTSGDEHLKELESLVLRIAAPKGNRAFGKFVRSEDLKRGFRKRIQVETKQVVDELMGYPSEPPEDKAVKPKHGGPRGGDEKPGKATLAPYVRKRFHIRLSYKGRLFIAHVRRNGMITFATDSADHKRLAGKRFTSPSAAANAATGGSFDGWHAWRFKNDRDEWVLLDELRKK